MSEIREFIFNEPLFDTHEHQGGYSQDWGEKRFDDFLAYTKADLATAGVPFDPDDPQKTFEVWPFVRTTGYGQAVELAVRDLFGLDYSAANADAIDEAIQELFRGKTPKQIYENLFSRANIKWVVTDVTGQNITPLDSFSGDNFPAFFKCSLRFGRRQILLITEKSQIESLEQDMNWSIQSLADLDRLMDEHTQRAKDTGNLVAFKISMAYARPLDFADTALADAENVFAAIMKGQQVDAKPLHDYLMHRICERAEAFDVPVQIHTGYLAGNWGDIRKGDPASLVPLLQKYQNVKFDLFHAAWPYCEFLGALAKHFPNVWIDLCWAWAMNPVQMERILDEWLSGVPSNKIFGFGADTRSPLPVVGYAIQARNGIAAVMEKKLATGEYDLATAKFVASRIMHENAREVFRM